MFRDFKEKHVLVIGQGPVDFIARNLGFSKVTTMSQLRHAFPTLDAVDHKRRRAAPCAFEKYFPRIEAIVLFGEPIRWETSLQLIIDVLVTDGLPCINPQSIPLPHLPILACNMDLQWMAEAPMPRFGHGAFLLCLEELYKKVTGSDLVYKGLIGKPSEITYRHGEHVLQCEAIKLGIKRKVKNIYCIGDNICTDIFGANLYNRYLHKTKLRQNHKSAVQNMETEYHLEENRRRIQVNAGGGGHKHSDGQRNEITESSNTERTNEELIQSRSIDHLLCGGDGICETQLSGAENCFSILVETGVYSRGSKEMVSLDHSPRDFLPVQESYQEPTYTVNNVLDAVNLIFEKQKFN
jgi:HAD superfamily hydrolase (TIGR01456 family)